MANNIRLGRTVTGGNLTTTGDTAVQGTTTPGPVTKVNSSQEITTEYSSFLKAMNVDSSIEAFTIAAGGSVADRKWSTSQGVRLSMSESNIFRQETLDDVTLNEKALGLLKREGVQSFRATYGDYFVQTVLYGRHVVLNYELATSFASQMQEVSANLKTKGAVKSKSTFDQFIQETQEHGSVTCKVFGVGFNEKLLTAEINEDAFSYKHVLASIRAAVAPASAAAKDANAPPSSPEGIVGMVLAPFESLPEFRRIASGDALHTIETNNLNAALDRLLKVDQIANELRGLASGDDPRSGLPPISEYSKLYGEYDQLRKDHVRLVKALLGDSRESSAPVAFNDVMLRHLPVVAWPKVPDMALGGSFSRSWSYVSTGNGKNNELSVSIDPGRLRLSSPTPLRSVEVYFKAETGALLLGDRRGESQLEPGTNGNAQEYENRSQLACGYTRCCDGNERRGGMVIIVIDKYGSRSRPVQVSDLCMAGASAGDYDKVPVPIVY